MVSDARSGLADIMHDSKETGSKSIDQRIDYVKDELDEPKHKIVNPLLFAKTREVLGNLISRRMKTSGGTDVDWLIEHHGGFMIFELKIFHDDRMVISKAQMIAYEKIYENLPKCHVLFIGHDDVDFSNLGDPIWLFEMREWKSGSIPHVEGGLIDPTYSTNEVTGYRVERDFMEKIDVKILRDRIDSIWNEFERIK